MLSQRVVVVGGRGFIGNAIADRLRRTGHDVTIVTSDPEADRRPGFRYADMLRPETLPHAVAGADYVVQSANFHNYPFEKPRLGHTFRAFDEIGTRALVSAAMEAQVRRYLFISGVGASLESNRPYLQAIARGEKYLFDSNLEAVSLRPAFVYGPRDNGLNRILRFARRSPVIPIVGNGRQLHQPVYVEDVAEAAHRLLLPDAPTGVFEIGGPERMTMEDMLRRTLCVARMRRVICGIPYWLASSGAKLLEHLPGPVVTARAIRFAADPFVADSSLLSPFPVHLTKFEDGLSRYLSAG